MHISKNNFHNHGSYITGDDSFKEYMKEMDKTFGTKLLALIKKRGMTNAECYNKAFVDRRLFYKIKNDAKYKPTKRTAVAFVIALKLNLEETDDLLASAGLTLSDSLVFDKIIKYFIQEKNYDFTEIDATLHKFDQVCLTGVK